MCSRTPPSLSVARRSSPPPAPRPLRRATSLRALPPPILSRLRRVSLLMLRLLDCVSTPVRQCENIPNANKRTVARTVCDTVVDSHEVEDCTETITEVCEQTNTYSHTTGKRVGVSVL